MEKYSQFRDRGSGIAPFFPVPTESSGVYLPFHIFLFFVRLPFLLSFVVSYFLVLQWLPIGSLGKKFALWLIMGTPGIWWIDLQVDGVRRGAIASNSSRLPQPGTIIASSFTSPIDALYLAAIFDPIFTASYPSTRLVRRITLFQAVLRAFSNPELTPPSGTKLVRLSTLIAANPHRVIAVFPECTTTNGRGILPFSPSLLDVPAKTRIYPISLRYTAADITTPVPGSYRTFLWNMLSKPTHCIRVRIAETVTNTSNSTEMSSRATGYEKTLTSKTQDEGSASSDNTLHSSSSDSSEDLTAVEKQVLDKIGEALARLGRVKRVGLGAKEKAEFVKVWSRHRRP